MSEENDNDLKMTQELYEFLQGITPEGITIRKKHVPKLTAEQAWAVIWYLGNQHWQVTDRVEKCDVCGELFHTWQSGNCLDYGKSPYHFCADCMNTDTYTNKMRRNPDRHAREDYFEK